MDVPRPRRFPLAAAFQGPYGRRRLAWLAVALVAAGVLADRLLLGRDARAAWLSRQSPRVVRTYGALLPGDAAVDYAWGRQARAAGEAEKAAGFLRRAVERDATFLAARAEYALALIDLRREHQATPMVEECLRQQPGLAPAIAGHSRLSAARGEWDRALETANLCLAQDRANADAWRVKSQALAGKGDWPAAEAAAARAVALEPRQGRGWRLRATAALGRGAAATALPFAEQAVRLEPGSPAAQRCLGLALLVVGDLARAETALREAIRLDPLDSEAQLGLGRALVRQLRWAEAAGQLEYVALQWPEANEARTLLVEVSRARGQRAAARRWTSEAAAWARFLAERQRLQARIKATRYDPRPHVDLAWLYARMGLWDAASRELNLGLALASIPEGLALRKELDRRRQAAAGAHRPAPPPANE